MKWINRFFSNFGHIAALAFLIGVIACLGTMRSSAAQSPGCTPGPHSGTITADETWCVADSPHMVTDWLAINPGVTVTIEPGSVVKSKENIHIGGSLVAVGTADQPIIFTSLADSAPMQWRGLYFEGADASGDLRHVVVRYAGYTGGYAPTYMIYVSGLTEHSLRIEDSVITDGYEPAGLNSFFPGLLIANSNAIVKNNLFSNLGNNAGTYLDAPFFIEGNILDLDISGNTFTNNNRDAIVFGHRYGEPSPTVTSQLTLVKNQPWVMETDMFVAPGATLTLEPGAVFMGHHNTELQTQGHLEAVGTPEEPIIFRSWYGTHKDQWTGLTFMGGTGNLNHIVLQNGGGDTEVGNPAYPGYYYDYQTCAFPPLIIHNVLDGEVRIENSTFRNNGNADWWRADGIMTIYNSHVVLNNNYFTDNGAPVERNRYYIPEDNFGIFAYGPDTVLSMTGNTFDNNRGWSMLGQGQFTLERNVFRNQPYGIKFNPNVHATASNLVFADLAQNGLLLNPNVTLDAQHLTFARNGNTAITVTYGANLTLTNSILAQNATGIQIDNSGAATLNNTLWDRNTNNKVGNGSLNDIDPFTGAAGFGSDGYHLTKYSSALQKGIPTGLDVDIDGETRPAPADTMPDLGADEFTSQAVTPLIAESWALEPRGILTVDPLSGDMSFKVQQDYFIRFFHGSDVPVPLPLTITDILPDELTYESETHSPAMTFDEASLVWQTLEPVDVDQSAEVTLRTFGYPQPTTLLLNRSIVQAGEHTFDLSVSSIVPQYPPIITQPGNGEYCYNDGVIEVTGYAWANSVVRLFENNTQIAETTSDANGRFNITYTTATPAQDLTLVAQVCTDASYAQCSTDSEAVTITPALSFICPQRSVWSDTRQNGELVKYHFRDATGTFASQNWIINGYYGFWDTQLDLYACNCPASSGTTERPTLIWLVADGVTYQASGTYPWYHFDITGGAHNVVIWAQCGENQVSSSGDILIDPDGFVFDSTLGFDPSNPSAHALEGATVTAYVWKPDWGGWTIWPAQLYNEQKNPQVTGADGYFAFYTPPGQYYLQVTAPDGFQSWRSPVIEVVNELVHVNVPLTPLTTANTQLILTSYGAVRPEVTITAGQTVEWLYLPDESIGPERVLEELETPIVRLQSTLDPLSDPLGFDSGMLAPYKVYRHRFTTPGTYSYTNGRGYSATIIVEPGTDTYFYLPLIFK